MSENVFIRPGALIIFFMAMAVGAGVFNWSSELLDHGDRTQTSDTIDCAVLDVDVFESSGNATHHTVYVRMDQDANALAVTFIGEERNATMVSEYGSPGTLSAVTAPVGDVKGLEIHVEGCSRVFDR